MKIRRYDINNPFLKRFIKFIWVLDSKIKSEVAHLLLPVNNVDLILNFSSPIRYEINEKKVVSTREFHLNGLRKHPMNIMQKGKLNIIGISFMPYGLFDFFKIPVSEFTNGTIELNRFSKSFSDSFLEKIEQEEDEVKKIEIVEEELLKLLGSNQDVTNFAAIYREFNAGMSPVKINEFCHKCGINERHLERLFNKYIGVGPKSFIRITRFQEVCNRLFKNDFENLSMLAQECFYYDQMHFIKECKHFTGRTPLKLIKENVTVKSIIRYT